MAGSWLNLVATSSSTTRPASGLGPGAGGVWPSRESPNRAVATAAVAARTARAVVSTRSRLRKVIAQALLQGGRNDSEVVRPDPVTDEHKPDCTLWPRESATPNRSK